MDYLKNLQHYNMKLLIPDLSVRSSLWGLPSTGKLVDKYSPFQNLNTNEGLSDLRIHLDNFGERPNTDYIYNPIQIEVEPSYDGSANVLFSDKQHTPRLVNSRFYLTDSSNYRIADRKGNIDTNIYTTSNFEIESSLIKKVNTITTLDFLGIYDGGRLSVGNYTFYFKLADGDDNMTDFISESGKVVCHIGSVNKPESIRGGQKGENSEKLVKFRLNNLDQAYQYIRVYYSRSTGDENEERELYYFIEDKFKITGSSTSITITGFESISEVSYSDINTKYESFDSVNTLTIAQNMTFVGGINNNYNIYSELEQLSLRITPQLVMNEDIGRLDNNYKELYNDISGYEYYNAKNIYYKLGYWDDIYRFGIVYIMNNYTLSPVFNIRGTYNLTTTNSCYVYDSSDIIPNEDYILPSYNSLSEVENSKGVVKINISGNNYPYKEGPIKPVGIKFNFQKDDNVNILEGFSGHENGLNKLTRGFIIVRQKRIPTIITQGVAVGLSKKGYFPIIKSSISQNKYIYDSFLRFYKGKPILGHSSQILSDNSLSSENALFCPEACLKTTLFNNFFNSSEFKLYPIPVKGGDYFLKDTANEGCYYFKDSLNTSELSKPINSKITIVEPGIELIGDGTNYYSSKAGDAIVGWKHSDPENGNIEDISTNESYTAEELSDGVSKVRGSFNTFLGSSESLSYGQYYNIYQKDYDPNTNISNYFLIRYNDSSSYHPITDRVEWGNLSETSIEAYRGDCYINTYTHRINWNFIDPDMPTNNRILDPYSWYKNYKVKLVTTLVNSEGLAADNNDNSSEGSLDNAGCVSYSYKKILPLFTYKIKNLEDITTMDTGTSLNSAKVLTPSDKKFKKYSEDNGLFGTEKINRPDINSVALGQWVTFKICSSTNLAMRDIDFSNPEEESIHKQKRSFYPLQAAKRINRLPESSVINLGISKTLGSRNYFEMPNVPFIQTNFNNRIFYSNVLVNSAFQNGNRIFEYGNYQDYTMEYGALIKLIEWYGTIISVMEHGVLCIPVNERAMMTNSSGDNVYINTDNVLPKNPKVLSNTFGSLWASSIIKTSKFIYGIDTVAKKIWRTNGQTFDIISEMSIQKFLNDKMTLKEADKIETVGINFIKSHYNAFKQDVLFVFKYDDIMWNICWNELTSKWVTQYTWFPEFSENINNIFYTFANQGLHKNAKNNLYKHGFAGSEEIKGIINPTYWYDEQHPFEFEFTVTEVQGIQKVFNNLKIISNMVEPDSFYYEIVGEGFNWIDYKNLILKLNDLNLLSVDNVDMRGLLTVDQRYEKYLKSTDIKKIPYIITQYNNETNYQYFDINNKNSFFRKRDDIVTPFKISSLRDLSIRQHTKTKENLVNIYQKGVSFKKYGRVKGNMNYVEDAWDIQISPINFQYAYLNNGVYTKSNYSEMRIRDKYIKIRIKYSGTMYAIINAIKTYFTISYS